MTPKKSLRDIGRQHAKKKTGATVRLNSKADPEHALEVTSGGRSVTEQAAWRSMPIPGDTFHGFCGGAFGRVSFGKKTVIASGVQHGGIWLVVREEYRLILAQGVTPEDIARWRRDAEDEEQER